jgi:hypothetical protein
MPTLEAQDYEYFSYDESPLSLDEAIKKASELRRADAENFYRIRPANDKNTSFVVLKVPVASVYAELAARVSNMARRFSFHTRRVHTRRK